MTSDSPFTAVDRASAVGGTVLAHVIGAIDRARPAARPLHPRGRVCHGELHRHGTAPRSGVPWLDETGTDPVLLRVSRSIGLPAFLPDVLGLAIRVGPDGDRPADLLFASTGGGRITRYLLAPTRDSTHLLTTLMPFRTAVGPVLLGARRAAPDRFELSWSGLNGPWRPFARLDVRGDVPWDDDERPRLELDPVRHVAPGLESYDWARHLRAPAYDLARSRRSSTTTEVPVTERDDHLDDTHDETLTDDELADEMSEESFPGSDPPSTWAGPAN